MGNWEYKMCTLFFGKKHKLVYTKFVTVTIVVWIVLVW